MKSKFVNSEIFKISWKSMKSQIWVMSGLFIAYCIVNGVLSMLLTAAKGSLLGEILSQLLLLVFNGVFILGYIKNCMQTLDGEEPQFSAYGSQLKKLLNYIGAVIIYCIVVCVGLCLLIIPGIYLALRLQFYVNAIVEDDLGCIDSLKKSWEITKGETGHLFGLWLIFLVIEIVGLICLIVGIFVAIPLVYIMQVAVYRKLIMIIDQE